MQLFKKPTASVLDTLLQQSHINITQLRLHVFVHGIDSQNADKIRPIVWKILLQYYSPDVSTWAETETTLHKDYQTFVSEFFPRNQPSFSENPAQYSGDMLLLHDIDKDVRRLFPKNAFFTQDLTRTCIRQILYVHSKYFRTCPYVQGMNDLAGVLFYVFEKTTAKAKAESTTYYCFAFLMTQLSNWYDSKKDWTVRGIHATLNRIDAVVLQREPDVFRHLQHLGITNTLYSFRWVTLLFAQEFAVQDVVVVWDALLVDPTGDFVCCLCVAMILEIKRELLAGDFSTCLQLLQKYPQSVSVHAVLKRAKALYGERATFPPLVEPSKAGAAPPPKQARPASAQ